MFNKKLWEVEKERRGDLLCRDIECIMGNVVFLSSVLPLRPAGWVRLCSMATTSHTHTETVQPSLLLLLLLVFLPSLSADFLSEASLLLPHTGDQFVLQTGIHIFLITGTTSFWTPQPTPRSPLCNRPSTSLPSEPPSGHISSYMFT